MNIRHPMRARALTLLAATAFGLSSHASHAQTGAEDCTLNMSSAKVDFGRNYRATLWHDAHHRDVGEQSITLTVQCPTPRPMRLHFDAPAAGLENFLWNGHIPGHYRLAVSNTVVDGKPVELADTTTDRLLPANTQRKLPLRPGRTLSAWRDGRRVTGTHFSMQIDVAGSLNEDASRVRDVTHWQATGHFEFAGAPPKPFDIAMEVVPVACSPQLANEGTVDFGQISATSLQQNDVTTLATRDIGLQVTCDGPARFALRLSDDRGGTALEQDATHLGLGRDKHGAPIGQYGIRIDTSLLRDENGQRIYVTQRAAPSRMWEPAQGGSVPLRVQSELGFTGRERDASGPAVMQTLQGTLQLELQLAPAKTLELKDVVRLDGHATLELLYL